ncbi:DNA replication complex subunit Gins51 [Natrinema altunense]|uniref:DNA replication complex subunit Gins51 n=1 Tax=Natrinema altunense TaxID=222984 RepID=UPI001184B9CE|nr:hypothetical protein [Natrinema altunense]
MTSSDHSYLRVRMKNDFPEFTGTDLEIYGPYEEGDKPRVPEDNADIMVNRGNAEYLDEGDES